MKARSLIGVGLGILVLGVGTVVPGFAGGWAVVTLDSLPEGVIPGGEFTVGFTVRQHGFTPLSDLEPAPVVTAKHLESGEVVRSIAAPQGGPGHYAAELSLPSSGEWSWGILAFGPEPQPMPPLVVSVAGQPATAPASATTSAPAALASVAAALALLGIVLAFRRRFAFSGIAILLAAILAGVSFARAEPSPSMAEAAPPVAVDQGAALFVAKGCVVCHVNGDVPQSESISSSIGPDLSQYSNDPVFLSRWLADPADVRPATLMPNLGLQTDEIQALIVFLNGEGDS